MLLSVSLDSNDVWGNLSSSKYLHRANFVNAAPERVCSSRLLMQRLYPSLMDFQWPFRQLTVEKKIKRYYSGTDVIVPIYILKKSSYSH